MEFLEIKYQFEKESILFLEQTQSCNIRDGINYINGMLCVKLLIEHHEKLCMIQNLI